MSWEAAVKVVAIAAMNVRRFLRERSNLFFVFVFPLAIVLLVGLQFGSSDEVHLGVVNGGGHLARALVTEVESHPDVVTVVVSDTEGLVDRVKSGDLDAGVVVPDDFDALVAAGGPVELQMVTGAGQAAQQLGSVADEALARVLAGPTAERAAVERGASPEAAAAAAERLAPAVIDRVAVRATTTGDRLFPEGTDPYDVAAPSQVVLFMFITGLTASAALIDTRRLGVSTRMMSTPTSVGTIILGEAVGRLAIGIIQGVYILVATMVVFHVDWGDPLSAMAVLVAMAAVSAGAAMCFGTFFDTPEQASGIGAIVGLALAALGGAMLPIELFSDTLTSVARLTPHYWAIDAYGELLRRGGSLGDITTQLAVLAGFAVVLTALATWRMRRVLTRAS
jgi:ABC-2 type transport system permease protein